MPALLGNLEKTYSSQVNNVAFSPDGSVLAAACNDAKVRLFSLSSASPLAKPVTTLEGHARGALGLAYFPDGTSLVVSDYDSLWIWDVNSAKPIARIPAHESWVYWVAVSPDGNALLSTGNDFHLRLWDVPTRALRFEWKGPKDSAEGLAIAPDGRSWAIAVGSRVSVWDSEARAERFRLEGHRQRVKSLAFSPDGSLLASASYDKSIKLWDLAAREERRTLTGHKNRAWCVAWRPDGRAIASAGWDATVRLWDTATGEENARLVAPRKEGPLLGVALSPDGRTLATCGGTAFTGDVALWDVSDVN